jgi:alkylation response protein AidB-like acyl-CoA dehydrogenase
MQIDFTEDQVQFREVVARFLQDKSQPTAVRQLMETESGYDKAVWQQLTEEIGLAGTHLPEAYGGFGFGPVELGITAEEMGRYLYCGPFFASAVMAAGAVLIAADESAKQALLPDIAAGSTIATLVLDNLDDPQKVGQRLSVDAGRLNGKAGLVVDAINADQFIVIASTAEGLGLFVTDATGPGIEIAPVQSLDPTRKLADVTLTEVEAKQIGTFTEATLAATWDYICIALAHEMIGGAQHLLDTTVDYTRLRYQFGRPIGSFQGLKHRLADLLMELEMAKAATHHAAFALAAGEADETVGSMAKAMASDVYLKAAKEAIQMRGGIGFTWEEDTHLWFKRAKSSEVFMGTPTMHRERMMTQLEKAS